MVPKLETYIISNGSYFFSGYSFALNLGSLWIHPNNICQWHLITPHNLDFNMLQHVYALDGPLLSFIPRACHGLPLNSLSGTQYPSIHRISHNCYPCCLDFQEYFGLLWAKCFPTRSSSLYLLSKNCPKPGIIRQQKTLLNTSMMSQLNR